MDKIKEWAVVISAVSVISGVLLSVVPEGKLRPAYKTLISIVLVYCIMLPLINSWSIDFSFEEYLRDNYEVSENYDKYALQSVISSAQKAVEETLSEYSEEINIPCNFDVKCEFSEEQVFVSEIAVIGADTAEIKDKITAMIIELGFEKEIIKFKGEADE